MSERLPAVKPQELIRVLERRGWQLIRTGGSHHVFKHPEFPNRIVVRVEDPCQPSFVAAALGRRGFTLW